MMPKVRLSHVRAHPSIFKILDVRERGALRHRCLHLEEHITSLERLMRVQAGLEGALFRPGWVSTRVIKREHLNRVARHWHFESDFDCVCQFFLELSLFCC